MFRRRAHLDTTQSDEIHSSLLHCERIHTLHKFHNKNPHISQNNFDEKKNQQRDSLFYALLSWSAHTTLSLLCLSVIFTFYPHLLNASRSSCVENNSTTRLFCGACVEFEFSPYSIRWQSHYRHSSSPSPCGIG